MSSDVLPLLDLLTPLLIKVEDVMKNSTTSYTVPMKSHCRPSRDAQNPRKIATL